MVINYSGMEKKFTKMLLKAEKKGANITEGLAYLGRDHAKSIVPYDTGRTASMIIVRTKKGHGTVQSTIIAQNPTAFRRDKFNLVRYMHSNSDKADNHFHTGTRRFMTSTRIFLNKIKKGFVTGQYKKLITK